MATLKISDLSVGDWVGVRCGTKINAFKVEEIRFNNIIHKYVAILNNGAYGLPTAELHPIPITAEMLEKNGWENLRLGYKCSCGVYDIHIWIKEASVIVTIYEQERILKAARMQVNSPDMSVHQLQHILRLAGVDKEINL